MHAYDYTVHTVKVSTVVIILIIIIIIIIVPSKIAAGSQKSLSLYLAAVPLLYVQITSMFL